MLRAWGTRGIYLMNLTRYNFFNIGIKESTGYSPAAVTFLFYGQRMSA